jgi:mannitol/fructose-specific phosphotransferase system IIA component
MKILLRIVEGAGVALVKTCDDSEAELLPTRYDLYQYRGGIAWGYKGSGVTNLAYAIAARLTEDMHHEDVNVAFVAEAILNNVLCYLDENAEHDIDKETLVDCV